MPYIRRRRFGYDHSTNRPVYVRDVVTATGEVTLTDICGPKTCSDRDVILLHHESNRWARYRWGRPQRPRRPY